METILVISPYDVMPPVTGGYVRTHNIVRHLSRRYHVILLHGSYSGYKARCAHIPVSQIEGVQYVAADPPHRFAQVLNIGLIRKGREIIKARKPKAILNEFIWSGGAALSLHILTGIPYILDQQNVEFLRLRRFSPMLGWLTKQWEMALCHNAEKVLCVSEVDRLAFVQAGVKPQKLMLVPNGVAPERCLRDDLARARVREERGWHGPVILFFGALRYRPNREAIRIIDEQIVPRVSPKLPDASFVVVGPSPPLWHSNSRLTFIGAVERIEDYIKASDVVICPLRSGGGTRLKILETIACGKPVVSTSLGAEGLIGQETGSHIIVRDDWGTFSREVVKIAQTRTFPGPSSAFLTKYSWANIVEPLIQLIDALPSRA